MAPVKKGDSVKVEYTGMLTDGTVFDSSVGRGPLSFTVGASEVISGFEEAVIGMEPGEKQTAEIPADKAYGQRNEELVIAIGYDQLPPGFKPEKGDQLQSRSEDGHPVRATVAEVHEDHLVLDANHPLAGKDLVFEIKLLEIVSAG